MTWVYWLYNLTPNFAVNTDLNSKNRNAAVLCDHATLHLNGGHTAHGDPMNRPGLTKDHIIWIKTGSHRKRERLTEPNQIKRKH